MARSAVEGLQEFQQHMQEAAGSYALIGGTACDILLAEAGLPLRATHDFDVVIVADDRLPQTAEAIWTLVRDGGYRCGWGEGKGSCFYRFTEPKRPGYPHMIELFAKCPDFLKGREGIVLHCFGEDRATMERFVELGCYIAYGGAATFKRNDDVREAFAATPLDRILFETDCPYMAPEPIRGLECEPAMISITANALVNDRVDRTGEDAETIVQAAWENASKLFQK